MRAAFVVTTEAMHIANSELIHVPAAVAILLALLLGSIPFGLLIARTFFKVDLRKTGSGNIGAANALRTIGNPVRSRPLRSMRSRDFCPRYSLRPKQAQ